jgi:hypothetical protein
MNDVDNTPDNTKIVTCSKCSYRFWGTARNEGKCNICGTKNDRRKAKAWDLYSIIGKMREEVEADWPTTENKKGLNTKLDIVIAIEGLMINRFWFD